MNPNPLRARIKSLLLTGLPLFLIACSQPETASAYPPPPPTHSDKVVISKMVAMQEDTVQLNFLNNYTLFTEGWDTLAQPKFWKQIICLSPDSCIINVAKSRTPLQTTCYKNWCTNSELQKTQIKNQMRNLYCVADQEELYVTNGKKEFYEHRKTIPTISKAVDYFTEFGVDPWYAQTILLIESPGKTSAKSSVGANGPFQLMPSVARMYGLKITKYTDERSDLKRSAYAASRLISSICIPKVRSMLEGKGIAYKETDLWFRLMVLHAYHAGAGNLALAFNKLNPTEGGPQIIRGLWKTEAGGFKNESQNYSQIALAALLNFEDIIHREGDTIFMIQGDRAYSLYQRSQLTGEEGINAVNTALMNYERDFVDGIINFDYFMEKVQILRNELAILEGSPFKPQAIPNAYPANEQHFIALSKELLRKRKIEDAIKLLRYNVETYPGSAAAVDSLSRAYRIGGMSLSQKYMTKSTTK